MLDENVLMIEVGDTKYEPNVCDDLVGHTYELMNDVNNVLEQHGLAFVLDRDYHPGFNWIKYELKRKENAC